MTASNKNRINPNKILNHISLKGVEFFNMNVNHYQNVVGIEKRDFFNAGKRQPLTDDSTEEANPYFVGKLSIPEMKKRAIDTLAFRRE